MTISAPSGALVDLERLQNVADSNDVRIEIAEHDIVVEPRGRYRDPAVFDTNQDRAESR